MNQAKFVWVSKNIPNKLKIEMDPDGITIVKLRPLIDIIHNSTKRDKIEILFKDDNSRFIIPDQKILEEIYRIHMNNSVLMLLLHQYCEKNLSRS